MVVVLLLEPQEQQLHLLELQEQLLHLLELLFLVPSVLIVQMEDVYMKEMSHIAVHKFGIPPAQNVGLDTRVLLELTDTVLVILVTEVAI